MFRKQTSMWFQPVGSIGSGCDQSYRNPHLHLTGRAQAQETENHPRQPQNGQRNLGNKLLCRQCLQIPHPAGSPSPAPIKPQATQKTKSMGSEGQMHRLGLKLGPVTCVLCDLRKVTSPL